MKTRIYRRGWSLMEVLVVIAIMGLLVTLMFPVYAFVRAKLDFATCVGNLRAIHAGLSTKIQDNNLMWPQYLGDLTDDGGGEVEDALSRWWYEQLQPYGVTRKTWLCPGDRDGHEMDELHPESLMSSYSVTLFDDTPNTAYRWNQPWAIENGSNHGNNQGPNMVMPDGRVLPGIGMPRPNP